MYIKRLEILDVRNLQSIKIDPSKRFNLVEGLNGSGKTSLLEAIHLLSLGRSFRTPKIRNVISNQASKCTIFSVLCNTQNDLGDRCDEGPGLRVGLEKIRDGKTILRINGESQKSFANLANIAPVQVIAPELDNLIDCTPEGRRQMLDWGVFHVEHSFHVLWKIIQKALRQRNALLRAKVRDGTIHAWDIELIKAAEGLTQLRQQYTNDFCRYIDEMLIYFKFTDNVSLTFYQGWKADESFGDILNSNMDNDYERGFTAQGPHRADLRIRIDKYSAKDVCSRGQKKIISAAIKLAQIQMLKDKCGKNSVVLFDDLPSELDIDNRRIVCKVLDKMKSQVFITCVKASDLEEYIPDDIAKLFHVKHGTIKEMKKSVVY